MRALVCGRQCPVLPNIHWRGRATIFGHKPHIFLPLMSFCCCTSRKFQFIFKVINLTDIKNEITRGEWTRWIPWVLTVLEARGDLSYLFVLNMKGIHVCLCWFNPFTVPIILYVKQIILHNLLQNTIPEIIICVQLRVTPVTINRCKSLIFPKLVLSVHVNSVPYIAMGK